MISDVQGEGQIAPLVAQLAELGEPRDEYERRHFVMCENDPGNAKLLQITIKHLKARRQRVQH